MCGKFTRMRAWREVYAFYRHWTSNESVAPNAPIVATPMHTAPILRVNEAGEGVVADYRWGLPGANDKTPKLPRHIHARAETIDTLPTFAEAFALRRGLLLVDTFNEGEELPNGKTRQWTITPKDGGAVGIGVICETWRNGDQTLDCFVMATTPANALISRITDRMPAVIAPADWQVWLSGTVEQAKALLAPFDDAGSWEMEPQRTTRASDDPQRQLF